jgi:hypothetical protein
MLELALHDDNAVPDAKLGEGMVREFERQCKETRWSAERRRCLHAAFVEEDTLRCPAQ